MATYLSKDQNWQDGTTTYWFEFVGEIFGVAESGQCSVIVDCDGYPVNTGDNKNARLLPIIELVTDEMRQS